MKPDPIMRTLDEAIARAPEGWAITAEERENLYQSLVRYVEKHGEIPEFELTNEAVQ